MTTDSTNSVGQLVEGYSSLSKEYKILAQRHKALERQLSIFKQQNDALRRLLPSNEQASNIVGNQSLDDSPDVMFSSRTITDCITEIRGADNADSQISIAAIRLADFARFKLRDGAKRDDGNEHTVAAEVAVREISRPPSRKKARISFPDMEQDHTVTRSPGQLGCPFAAKDKQASNSVSKYDLPTPRSSASQISLHGARTHRTSFNDPIRPLMAERRLPLPDASDQGSDNGPACPIRFLDQHSPEDVAKYFEQHKHELPPSHEACVQRFQTNSESIKELDAKYGSLVTMIQGLGQKHQPMLPENPDSVLQEDLRSAQRVRKWAKAISEGQGVPQQHVQEDLETHSAHVQEERLSHFDRPLKEIRVGESPSRPWGVPIPSKYLDQAAKAGSDVSAGGGTQPAPVGGIRSANEDQAEVAPQFMPVTTQQRPKGKCPFGHGAAANELPGALTSNPPDMQDLPSPPKADMLPMDATSTRHPMPGRIVNHGLAVVADETLLHSIRFENRGTLLLGYSGADAVNFANICSGANAS